MPIVLRSSKNAALTFAEMDGNFTDLNTRINTKLDSTGVTSLINSSYIETIVDSSYVQLRQSMTGSYQNSNVDAHLNTNTASSGHVLKWNGLDYIWDSDLGGDLSVSTMGASGGGALSFDNSTGIFTYRPADLSGYVQLGSETSTLNDVIQRGHTTTTTAVIPFLYSNQGSFPNASTYHGAIAHSHADGAMYFAHAGSWHKLANDSDLNGDIDAHLNVSTATSGQVLSWNGTDYAWVTDQTGSGGGLTDLVNDTTPQLGGDLDVNGYNISFAENEKATFGDSDDLQIYHNGTQNIINGTGATVIRGNWLHLQKSGSTENYLICKADGAVELYYDNVKKLETTADGVAVTGKILYSNMYSQLADLPSATTYHGMFAHVHATGKAYYAHGGNWIELANQADIGSGGGGLDSAGVASYLSGNWDFHLLPETNATYDIGSAEYKVRHLYLSDNSLFFDSGQTSIGFESVGTSKNLKFNNNVVKEASHAEEAGGPVDISKTNHFVTTGATYDLPNGEYVGQELKFWHKTQGGTNIVRVNVLNAKWRNGAGVLTTIPNMLWDQDKENTACYGCIWDGEAWIIGEGSLGA